MMNQLEEKILQADFGKIAKKFIVVLLGYLVLAGAIGGLLLQTQIGEFIDFKTAIWEQRTQEGISPWEGHHNLKLQFEEKVAENPELARHGNEHRFIKAEMAHQRLQDKIEFHKAMTPVPYESQVVLGGLGAIGGAILVVGWALVAAWLYQAAVMAGMGRGALCFAVLSLFSVVAGVVVFLVIRSIIRVKCPQCGRWQKRDTNYCIECGASMEDRCRTCHSRLDHFHRFCPTCGEKAPRG